MRQIVILTFLILTALVVPNAEAEKGTTRTIKFSTGTTTIESGPERDHVIVRDLHGKLISESWGDSGAFDAYSALFTSLKAVAGRGDRAAVAKLCKYPLRVNGKKSFSAVEKIRRSIHQVGRGGDSKSGTYGSVLSQWAGNAR